MNDWRKRYKEAYEKWQEKEYPSSYKNYGYLLPKYPKVTTHNGLRRFATDFLKYEGHEPEVTGNTGRKIFDKNKGREIWIPGSGRNGTSDVKCDIQVSWQRFAVPVKIEIKVGQDFQSDAQIEYEEDTKANKALYWLIRCPEDLYTKYDALINDKILSL